MKPKNYRILLTIWIGLILFYLCHFLYNNRFLTTYPSILDKLYAITSFLWKYFLSILLGSLFIIPAFELNRKMTLRTKVFVNSVLLILVFFLVRHVTLVNSDRNNLMVWNFIYLHIFVTATSFLLLIVAISYCYKKGIEVGGKE